MADEVELPPVGSALRRLGERLAHLLDDDGWNNIEPLLLGVQAEFSCLPDAKTASIDLPLEPAAHVTVRNEHPFTTQDLEIVRIHIKPGPTGRCSLDLYTAEQMRAAVLAERERAAGQEPVAWQIFHPNGQTCGIYATWPRGVLSDNEKANGWGVRPLYTRPLAQPSSLERLRGEVEQMKRKAQGMIPEAWNDAIDAVLAKLGGS